MKNFLLIAGLLVGLVVVYVFVLKPLLAPAAKPVDPLGNALNTGVNTATGVLKKWWDFESDVAGAVLNAPGKVLHEIGSWFSGGNDINCSVAQNTQNAAYCRSRFPNVDRSGIDAPYAKPVPLTAAQIAANAADAAKYGSSRNAVLVQKAGGSHLAAGYLSTLNAPVHA